ncbi:MAG: SDR family oxidoreductase [Desulfatiglans sp.]|jgi:3-oxoacyl-[acyl-carrier protein] reductase|nr:SDR family oxidoreductase [Thermodesulfobacteriota bacterium]MEE4353087.1 SDR family oxidoreductase [Desulfatiglans sp.]
MILLEDKVAIITGSGRGIGKAIATLFAKEGASVVINDLDAGPAEETVDELKKMGAKAVACPGNVVDIDFPEKLMKTTIDAFGKLDVIVNNAGYTWDAVIQNTTEEQWYAMMDIHATAPFRIIKAATPYMRGAAKKEMAEGKRVHRKIVNITSLAGVCGNAGQVNYSAAKAALVGITKAMAKEWGRFSVNVNVVAYGFIETRLTGEKEKGTTIQVEGKDIAVGVPKATAGAFRSLAPLARAGTPEEAAGPVLFLASPLADYITGELVVCSGGLLI